MIDIPKYKVINTIDDVHFYYSYIFTVNCSHVFFSPVTSHDVVRGLMESQEEDVTEEGINYVAMRNLFVREAKEAMHVRVEKKTRTTHIRESAERMQLSRTVNPFHSAVDCGSISDNLSHTSLQMCCMLYFVML